MIIWLASYPRSGNTLLRTLLKQTMGLGSYSDEFPPPNIGFTEAAQEEFGHLPLIGAWESFYEMAIASKNIYLVKTHLPPRDDQPVIYVVRDGRSSLVSYHKYHRKFFPEHSGGLIELVLGADYYGGWSEHYENWTSGGRKFLLLHYEELVNGSPDLLQSIAQFVGHDETLLKWSNPFNRLHKENPDFFRVGKTEWQGAPGWSELINGVFFLLHGDLMNMLGYSNHESIEKFRASLTLELIEFVEAVQSIQRQRASLEKICRERLSVINALDAKVKSLSASNLMPLSFLKRFISWVR